MMADIEKKDERNEVKTISDLDDDSLLIIFSLLNIYDRTRCERVCQRWNNLIIHSWASTKSLVPVSEEEVFFWMDTEEKIIENATFHKILKKCPNLQSINLKQAFRFNEESCEIIGKCCPNLKKLILPEIDLPDNIVTMIGKVCPKLKSIDLSHCLFISERSLWELFNSRPDLEYITLNLAQYITGKCFYLLNALSHLDLSGCVSICPEAFSKLGQNCSQSLKTLYAPSLNNESLKIICMTFPNLKVLQVDSSSGATLSGARLLGNLTKLQVLRYFPQLDDGALLSIIKHCPDLRELSLCDNYKLTDLSFANLPEYCENLRTLILHRAQISDDFARSLAHLKKLTVLDLSDSFITDEGAMYILAHSTVLEFSIDQCRGISNKTILYAWDLVKQGLVSKDLLMRYNLKPIQFNDIATREECKKFFATKEEYGREDFYDDREYDDFEDEYNDKQNRFEQHFHFDDCFDHCYSRCSRKRVFYY